MKEISDVLWCHSLQSYFIWLKVTLKHHTDILISSDKMVYITWSVKYSPKGDGSLTSYSPCDGVCFLDVCLSPYSKLLLTSPTQVLSLVAEEKAALQAQLSQEGDAQGCFIQSAQCLLQVTKPACLSDRKLLSKWQHIHKRFTGWHHCIQNIQHEQKHLWWWQIIYFFAMPLNVKSMLFSIACLQVEYETFFMNQNKTIHGCRQIFFMKSRYIFC